MYSHVEKQRAVRKNIFSDKETTNNEAVMFLDVNVLTER